MYITVVIEWQILVRRKSNTHSYLPSAEMITAADKRGAGRGRGRSAKKTIRDKMKRMMRLGGGDFCVRYNGMEIRVIQMGLQVNRRKVGCV
jgi:hypothetical protein